MPSLEAHLGNLREALTRCEKDISSAAAQIIRARNTDSTVWVLGNGGSMAVAQHFAQDMLKCHGVRAQALNCPSVLTAFANDLGFDQSFAEPLKTLMRPGDVVVVFSCSGSSRNYIDIASQARREREFTLVAVVGTDGGILKRDADVSVHVESVDYAVCETAFSIVADMVNLILKDAKEKSNA